MGGEFGIPGGRNSECKSMAVAAAGAWSSVVVEKAEVGLHPENQECWQQTAREPWQVCELREGCGPTVRHGGCSSLADVPCHASPCLPFEVFGSKHT